MKYKRGLAALLLAVLLLQFTVPTAYAASDPLTYAKTDLLMNVTTGEVYYSKNSDVPRDPASLTKLMTVYMLYEAMERGDITKDTQVGISGHTRSIAMDSTASNVPLYCGNYYSVDELLHATMTVSACDAACALGELLGGSESAFASQMTARAQELGWNMAFYDASGRDGRNRVTADSLAALASALITKYPDILNYSSCSSIVFRGRTYYATNRLLPDRGLTYIGTDGLKTGTTGTAGCCLTATSVRDGNRMLAVVLGAGNNDVRYGDATRMMDYGFSRAVTLYRSDAKFQLNGKSLAIKACQNGGCNYVCLRAFAAVLSGTENAFSIGWDGATNTITLSTGNSETAGGTSSYYPETVGAKQSSSCIMVNGQAVSLSGYETNGTHYYAIRDLASILGLNVSYDGASNSICLTSKPLASPAKVTVLVDGKSMEIETYLIDGSSYFKLRDIAMALNGTEKQFEVSWDSSRNAIQLSSSKAYAPVGGELDSSTGSKRLFAEDTTSAVSLDGSAIALKSYSIGGYNYFKLSDIGTAMHFGVDWDDSSSTIVINTTAASLSASAA